MKHSDAPLPADEALPEVAKRCAKAIVTIIETAAEQAGGHPHLLCEDAVLQKCMGKVGKLLQPFIQEKSSDYRFAFVHATLTHALDLMKGEKACMHLEGWTDVFFAWAKQFDFSIEDISDPTTSHATEIRMKIAALTRSSKKLAQQQSPKNLFYRGVAPKTLEIKHKALIELVGSKMQYGTEEYYEFLELVEQSIIDLLACMGSTEPADKIFIWVHATLLEILRGIEEAYPGKFPLHEFAADFARIANKFCAQDIPFTEQMPHLAE